MGYDGVLCVHTREEFDRYCEACKRLGLRHSPSMAYRADGDYSVIDFGSIFRSVFERLGIYSDIMTVVKDGQDDAMCPDREIDMRAVRQLPDLRDELSEMPMLDDLMTVMQQTGPDDDDVCDYWSAIIRASDCRHDFHGNGRHVGWDSGTRSDHDDEWQASMSCSMPLRALKYRADLYRCVDHSGIDDGVAYAIKDAIMDDGPLTLYAIDTFSDVVRACDDAGIATLRLSTSY